MRRYRYANAKVYNLYSSVLYRRIIRHRLYIKLTKFISLCFLSTFICTSCASAVIVGYTADSEQISTSKTNNQAIAPLNVNTTPVSAPINITQLQGKTPTNITIAAHNSIMSNNISATPSWTKLPMYVDPGNEATAYYQANPTAENVNFIDREGQTPVAEWFGDWTPDVQSAINAYVTAAAQAITVPVLVLYNIPDRDCGGYSAGGAANEADYISWINAASAGIGNKLAVVILEPDALAGLDCLSSADQQSRYDSLSQAVTILKNDPNLTLYLDAGNPAWQTVSIMAQRLQSANIAQADGFSINVSNFVSTSQNQTYGNQLSKLVGNKHFVIDTSRNGNSGVSPDDWCNSSSAALGNAPSVNTGDPLNDAWLWIKIPWESDGTCNGGPAAGMVYWSFAIQLAANAGW
jgi:endoglucanase